jgi:hypothetical protein
VVVAVVAVAVFVVVPYRLSFMDYRLWLRITSHVIVKK